MKHSKLKYELLAGICFLGVLTPWVQYSDISGFGNKHQLGRTKNSIAAVVSAITAHEMYGNADIDVSVKKHFFPDAQVKGYTTPSQMDTTVDLTFGSSYFHANKSEGLFEGVVSKSEFDWNIHQVGKGTYEIERWGLKFNSTLMLNVENGQISGTYVRPGLNINWDIEGTYDSKGNINVEIDAPLTLGITLEGKITQD